MTDPTPCARRSPLEHERDEDDLIERLRSGNTPQVNGRMMTWEAQCKEAADLYAAVLAERDALRAEVERLTNAARAVLDRWDLPSWAEAVPTAAVMADLRAALGDQDT